jgi:hypothetical protein
VAGTVGGTVVGGVVGKKREREVRYFKRYWGDSHPL